MAIYKEQLLPNGDTVRYHRISGYKYGRNNTVRAVVQSYRNSEHRGFSMLPVVTREVEFPHSGNAFKLAREAYAYLQTLPEWGDSTKV